MGFGLALTTVFGSALALSRCWCHLAPNAPPMERLGAGFVMAAPVALVVSQSLRGWVAPQVQFGVFISLVLLASLSSSPIFDQNNRGRSPISAITLASAPALLGVIGFALDHPIRPPGTTKYFVDAPFFQGLSNSLATLGPFENIFFLGGSIRYHWFVYGWIGAVDQWTDVEPFFVQTWLMPLVALVSSAVLTAAITWLCVRSKTAVFFAVALATTSAAFFRFGLGSLLPEYSPSHATSVAWMLLLLLVVLRVHEAQKLSFVGGVTIFLLAALVTGGKVTHAAVLVPGVMSLGLYSLRQSKVDAKLALWLLLLVSGGAMTTFALFIAGGTGALEIGFSVGTSVPLVALPVWAAFRVLGWSGRIATALLVPSAPPLSALWALKAMTPGVLIAGMGGFLFTKQPGGSNQYFMSSASSILVVSSGIGAASVWSRLDRSDRLKVIFLASSVTVVGALWMLHSGPFLDSYGGSLPFGGDLDTDKLGHALTGPLVWTVGVVAVGITFGRRSLFSSLVPLLIVSVSIGVGIVDDLKDLTSRSTSIVDAPWTGAQRDAAEWLRVAARGGEAVATNRFCEGEDASPPVCGRGLQGRYFWVAAVSGKQMYIEGFGFEEFEQMSDEARDRVVTSLRFTSQPTVSDHIALWGSGVRWVWLDLSQPSASDWDGFGEVRFENEAVRIVGLSDPDN